MSTKSILTHSLVFFPYGENYDTIIHGDDTTTPPTPPSSINPSLLVTKSTCDDWGLIPSKKPRVKLPEYKQNFVDILGKNGSIDATEILGSVVYGDRTDSIEFFVEEYPISNGVRMTFEELKRTIANYLHGKKLCMYLESDPSVFYVGRWAINDMYTDESWSVITLDYTLETFGYFFTVPISGNRNTF